MNRPKPLKNRKKIILNKPIQCSPHKGLTEVLTEIYNICKGQINGETKSFDKFKKEIFSIVNEENTYPFQIALILNIKGRSYYSVIGCTAWGYDYYIPETREDEERLKKETGYYDTSTNTYK